MLPTKKSSMTLKASFTTGLLVNSKQRDAVLDTLLILCIMNGNSIALSPTSTLVGSHGHNVSPTLGYQYPFDFLHRRYLLPVFTASHRKLSILLRRLAKQTQYKRAKSGTTKINSPERLLTCKSQSKIPDKFSDAPSGRCVTCTKALILSVSRL